VDKKQKEALVLAMLEKGESYREIAQKAKVSPNTIKAISNRAGLDETTSISSRAFELYIKEKTPVEVAIALNLEADKAINYYHQYFMLLGITEFTRVYLQIKDSIWQFVNLAKLLQNARIGDDEIIELLRIASGYLPRVRLEYDRVNEEINSRKTELNSWKAAITNEVQTYQQFVDRNIVLKNREDELLNTISELESKQAELQKTLDGLKQEVSEFQDNNAGDTSPNSEVELNGISTSDSVVQPPPNPATNYHQIEQEIDYFHPKVEPSSRKLIFDTKDFFQ
jgi:Bacterial regulatory proteins, luxR family